MAEIITITSKTDWQALSTYLDRAIKLRDRASGQAVSRCCPNGAKRNLLVAEAELWSLLHCIAAKPAKTIPGLRVKARALFLIMQRDLVDPEIDESVLPPKPAFVLRRNRRGTLSLEKVY